MLLKRSEKGQEGLAFSLAEPGNVDGFASRESACREGGRVSLRRIGGREGRSRRKGRFGRRAERKGCG